MQPIAGPLFLLFPPPLLTIISNIARTAQGTQYGLRGGPRLASHLAGIFLVKVAAMMWSCLPCRGRVLHSSQRFLDLRHPHRGAGAEEDAMGIRVGSRMAGLSGWGKRPLEAFGGIKRNLQSFQPGFHSFDCPFQYLGLSHETKTALPSAQALRVTQVS